ncbi:MAG: class III signal peptide-containing protein [Nitrospirota bacterium]
MLRGFKNSLGQGTLEYVIILAAVVAAVIFAAGYIKSNLSSGKGYDKLADQAATKIGKVSF